MRQGEARSGDGRGLRRRRDAERVPRPGGGEGATGKRGGDPPAEGAPETGACSGKAAEEGGTSPGGASEERRRKRKSPERRIPGFKKTWCRGTESNCPHGDFQSPALPTELPRHDKRVCIGMSRVWQEENAGFSQIFLRKRAERGKRRPRAGTGRAESAGSGCRGGRKATASREKGAALREGSEEERFCGTWRKGRQIRSFRSGKARG